MGDSAAEMGKMVGDSAAEDSAAEMVGDSAEDSVAEDSVAEVAGDSAEGMGQPKYF